MFQNHVASGEFMGNRSSSMADANRQAEAASAAIGSTTNHHLHHMIHYHPPNTADGERLPHAQLLARHSVAGSSMSAASPSSFLSTLNMQSMFSPYRLREFQPVGGGGQPYRINFFDRNYEVFSKNNLQCWTFNVF
jgi:hypothetical protein